MTVQIKGGKCYRNFLGEKRGPMAFKANDAEDLYPWWDGVRSYTAEGEWSTEDDGDERNKDYRLVAEWSDTPQEAEVPEDLINHPPHYTGHPSGVECIQITEHMNFCRGNAIKYIWRAGEKGSEIEDLKKAAWYIRREISRLEEKTA